MRLSKAAKTAIKQSILCFPTLKIDDVENMIDEYGGEPDVEKLIKADRRRTARRYIASSKDENNIRNVLAIDDRSGTYIVLDQCDDVEKIEAVIAQLSRKVSGINNTIRKARRRRTVVVAGQIGIEEILNTKGENA